MLFSPPLHCTLSSQIFPEKAADLQRGAPGAAELSYSIVDSVGFGDAGAGSYMLTFDNASLKGTVTLALAVFSAVGPSRRRHEAQLATEHVGVRY